MQSSAPSVAVSSTSNGSAIHDHLSRAGVSSHIRDAVSALLDLRPADPMAFMSEYFFNASYGTASVFRAYKLVSLADWSSPSAASERIGAAFEHLALPSAQGVRVKDCATFLSFFCIGYDAIRHSLSKVVSLHLDKDDLVTFEDFTELVVYHAFLEEVLKKVKIAYSAAYPNKRMHRVDLAACIASVLLLDQNDPILDARKRLFLALALPHQPKTDQDAATETTMSYEDFVSDTSARLLAFEQQ
ncbi:hypothetical protein BC831DRAFT_255155 [Entophlyctis helioformis]|nr:hypothetical protein BC831DRAFT_255155 [Entophlyctis helioformis]